MAELRVRWISPDALVHLHCLCVDLPFVGDGYVACGAAGKTALLQQIGSPPQTEVLARVHLVSLAGAHPQCRACVHCHSLEADVQLASSVVDFVHNTVRALEGPLGEAARRLAISGVFAIVQWVGSPMGVAVAVALAHFAGLCMGSAHEPVAARAAAHASAAILTTRGPCNMPDDPLVCFASSALETLSDIHPSDPVIRACRWMARGHPPPNAVAGGRAAPM